MFEPATTVFEAAVLVSVRYAEAAAPTTVVAVAELFARLGSLVPEVTLAVSTICEPNVVAALTVTASRNVPEAWFAMSGLLQVSVPVEVIDAAELHVHPAGAEMD